MTQKIKTVLIPESGLNLQPEGVVESVVGTDFSRTLSHLIATAPNGQRMVRCTSDGSLVVATSGIAYEIYTVETGDAGAAYMALHTYDQVLAHFVTDILVENNPAEISFRNVAGLWGDDKAVPVGFMSIDLLHYGMRIRNRGAGIAIYEFTIYR